MSAHRLAVGQAAALPVTASESDDIIARFKRTHVSLIQKVPVGDVLSTLSPAELRTVVQAFSQQPETAAQAAAGSSSSSSSPGAKKD